LKNKPKKPETLNEILDRTGIFTKPGEDPIIVDITDDVIAAGLNFAVLGSSKKSTTKAAPPAKTPVVR
jgi:hypothetical protein